MWIKGLRHSTWSRNIAVKPRLDSNADQLLHIVQSSILPPATDFALTTSQQNHPVCLYNERKNMPISNGYTLPALIVLKCENENQSLQIWKDISGWGG